MSTLTLALLGTIVAVAAAGGIVLLLSGKEIPAGMLALGAIAAGLLAGFARDGREHRACTVKGIHPGISPGPPNDPAIRRLPLSF